MNANFLKTTTSVFAAAAAASVVANVTTNCDISTIEKPPILPLHRNYTITCEADSINILNGKVPAYARRWRDSTNQQYWEEGHDFKN